jgi:D-serine deaminase-like pyridoxal phosphate-dependent protein
MLHPYAIDDPSEIYSPALLFYKDLVRQNIERAVAMAGDPARLRPHVKTHKTREITRMAIAAGIMKHKCATIAEAELLAQSGAAEVFLAYAAVGPTCERLARLAERYPNCSFAVACDSPEAARLLSAVMARLEQKVEVLLDLDVGMHRTGIAADSSAEKLYELIVSLPGLRPGGFHVYDGHIHDEDANKRVTAVKLLLEPVLELRERLERRGIRVPRIVAGGTPTFPVYAALNIPGLECSPGTCFLHDHNYRTRYRDLEGFTPAALLLTRVISLPGEDRITFDLGYKAVASDPPAGKRLTMIDIPDCEAVLQSEEHLVVRSPAAKRFHLGDVAYAMPAHVCPTCAMHREALVVEGGRVVERWEIVGRDRVITI